MVLSQDNNDTRTDPRSPALGHDEVDIVLVLHEGPADHATPSSQLLHRELLQPDIQIRLRYQVWSLES